MKYYSKAAGLFAAVAIVLGLNGISQANTGTALSLNQIQAGTEQTSPNSVLNPGFETVSSGVPNNWLVDPAGANVRVAAPQNPPSNSSVLGSFAAQVLTNQTSTVDPSNYRQTTDGTNTTLTFDQTKSYVLSAYMWNYGLDSDANADSNGDADLILVELKDPTNSGNLFNLALEANVDGVSASDGFFVYSTFNGSQFPNGATLDMRGDLGSLAGTRPDVWAQFDNIAITPSDQFSAPSAVPEPASATLLAVGGLLMLRRRRAA